MLMRIRRNPKVLGVAVGAAVTSLCLVTLALWWGRGDNPALLTHHHLHHHTLDGMNVSQFIDRPRQLILEPRRALDACSNSGGGGGGGGGKSKGTSVEVLVLVPSSPHNLAARSAVRESWGAYLPPTWSLVFYVGAVDSQSVQEDLSAEAQAHQDIAQDTTFVDSYSNLTLKTLGLLSWAHRSCPTATFIFKVDDDVYVNVPKLRGLVTCLSAAMRDIYVEKRHDKDSTGEEKECDGVRSLVSYYTDAKTHRYESYVLAGYLYRDITPYRDPTSKWHIPKTTYPKDVLPPFLSGTAYLLSSNVLPHLLSAARNIPAITLEDVYLTGLVASEELKLRLSKLEGVQRFRPRWQSACAYKTTLTAHGFTPGELRSTTHMAFAVSDGACEGVFTRIGLALNRVITSVFPRLPSSSSLFNDANVAATI